MKSEYRSAVCCECQRRVDRGASYSVSHGEYLMIAHPDAGVLLDVSKPGWMAEFSAFRMNVCEGSGTVPQALVREIQS